jgi:membrane-associated phospholipid phosphatase
VGLNWFISDVLKVYCGQLRPNFYALCEFDADTKTCLNENSRNAYKSFPSGHSSLAFCSMTIVSLYWLGKVGILRSSRAGKSSSLRTKLSALVAFSLPTSTALWIAASRIHDHYHHAVDVVTGAAIGTMCAQFCMALYYASIYATGAAHTGALSAGYPLQESMHMEEESHLQDELTIAVDDLPLPSTSIMNPTTRDTHTTMT